MVQVAFSNKALADLREIYDFIARDSPHYARKTVDRIRMRVRKLATAPESGQLMSEYSERGYREVLVGSCRVVFSYDEPTQSLMVIAVVHGRRDLQSVVDPR